MTQLTEFHLVAIAVAIAYLFLAAPLVVSD